MYMLAYLNIFFNYKHIFISSLIYMKYVYVNKYLCLQRNKTHKAYLIITIYVYRNRRFRFKNPSSGIKCISILKLFKYLKFIYSLVHVISCKSFI